MPYELTVIPVCEDLVLTSNQTDENLKEEGNRLFKIKQYENAIQCYSIAIIKNSEVPKYFTNRALCYIKLNQWDKAYTDCCRALEIDPSIEKAYFFQGIALIELRNYDEAINNLLKAHTLIKEKKINYGDELTSQLRKAYRQKQEKQNKVRQNQQTTLLSYLQKLLKDNMIRQIRSVKSSDDYMSEDLVMKIKNKHEKFATDLKMIFVMNDDQLKKHELPSYLCGTIGYGILKNPVVTPCGLSYDRKDIEEHLMNIGNFDPVSYQPLTVDQLIPNLTLKEIVELFTKENEWVNNYCKTKIDK
ncbi:E3 ubiquitin-protein ligase CHIP-like [Rhopalosiphum maidis]|uniref:E3 ubiquitin-protein ligase CHIP-like n=1 Tax=Rhopalosiphum maidis TaxID=43146 RepID=UPI000EFF548E|nr:E3 ubiquitin-protein ligase CHIP-like [Rhopalosiphum maidis]